MHGACAEFHSGIMCYTCERGYARISAKDVCKKCDRNLFLYFKIVIAIIIIFLYIAFQVNITFKANSSSNAGILLKQLVNHFQQVGMVSLVDLGWTPDIKSYFAIQEYFSFVSEEFITVDCFVEDFGYNLLTQKIVFGNILPIMLSILTVVFWLVTFYFNYILRRARNTNLQKVFDQVRVSVMIIVYLLFPEILRKCFALLNCMVIDDYHATKVLMYSPQITCWEGDHYSYIFVAAFPGLFMWGLLTPLFIFYLLYKHRKYIIFNIKGAKKMEKLQTQSIQALNLIDELRLGKGAEPNTYKTQILSFVTARQDEGGTLSLTSNKESNNNNNNNIVKRNNFFQRKGLQEHSAAGALNEHDFLKMNSLEWTSRKDTVVKETFGVPDKKPSKAQDEEESSPKSRSKTDSFYEKIKRASINVIKKLISGPALTEKEQRRLRMENGIMLKFLYRGYSPKFYFWEIIMFSKKFLLIFIGSFNDFFPSSTKAIVLLIFMAFYIFIQTKFKPFETRYLNNIEFTSLVMTFLTANMGIMLFTDDLKKISHVFLILILIFNFSFILLWTFYFYNNVIRRIGFKRFLTGLLRFWSKPKIN